MQVHAREVEVLVINKKTQQAYYRPGQLFASLARIFARFECLADEGRNLLGAFSCLSISRSQALGPCVSSVSADQS